MRSLTQPVTEPAHILIAEDSGVQALMLRHVLEQQGYQVSTANNGRTALDMAARLRPALVISDVNMPELTGYELCQRIKTNADLAATPVILVTSLSDSDDVLIGLKCGADSFISKPYNKNHLLACVTYALSQIDVGTALAEGTVEISYHGEKHQISASRKQILDLLLSTYEATVQRNRELQENRNQLGQRTAELLSANRFLDLIIDNIPDMIFIKDATDLKYVRVNAATDTFLGIAPGQLIGKKDSDFFSKEESDSFTAKDRDVLVGGAGSMHISEETIHTTHQGVRLIRTKKVAVLDENGVVTHLLGVSEDVTEQKELEKKIAALNTALQARAAELEAANHSLDGFTSAATHDLRSPLSVIGGFAGLLEKKYAHVLDEKGRHYVSVISANAKNMAKLIDDLLAFSRLGLGEITKAVVDVQTLTQQVLADILHLHSDDKKPVIELSQLPPARADAALLRQVLVNLLSNAVKYSGRAANPVINVSGRVDGQETVYSVRDNGAGFDMAYYDKLFEVFQRLHSDDEFEGAGVGLHIVQRIVTQHGGRVWAEGKVGQGATFHFALPN